MHLLQDKPALRISQFEELTVGCQYQWILCHLTPDSVLEMQFGVARIVGFLLECPPIHPHPIHTAKRSIHISHYIHTGFIIHELQETLTCMHKQYDIKVGWVYPAKYISVVLQLTAVTPPMSIMTMLPHGAMSSI